MKCREKPRTTDVFFWKMYLRRRKHLLHLIQSPILHLVTTFSVSPEQHSAKLHQQPRPMGGVAAYLNRETLFSYWLDIVLPSG
jgi:hypothetical protein